MMNSVKGGVRGNTVLADDMILVTHNTREFIRVEGIKVEDWTE